MSGRRSDLVLVISVWLWYIIEWRLRDALHTPGIHDSVLNLELIVLERVED